MMPSDIDLDELERLSNEADEPYAQFVLSQGELKELVRQARAYQQHVADTDLWQEIGRIKERLDNLETS